jgi:hypothetical protein
LDHGRLLLRQEEPEINELGRRRRQLTPSAWEETQHEGSGSEESRRTNDRTWRRASEEIRTGEEETRKGPILSATSPKRNRPAARSPSRTELERGTLAPRDETMRHVSGDDGGAESCRGAAHLRRKQERKPEEKSSLPGGVKP